MDFTGYAKKHNIKRILKEMRYENYFSLLFEIKSNHLLSSIDYPPMSFQFIWYFCSLIQLFVKVFYNL